MELTVTGAVWEWRGPAPYHFVTVTDDEAEEIQDVADQVSYGWGMIPVKATIGTELAAIAKGISASLTKVQRAVASATKMPAIQPIAKPPNASLVVNQPT